MPEKRTLQILLITVLLLTAVFLTTGCRQNSQPDAEPSHQAMEPPPVLTGEELVNQRCIECHTMDRIQRDRDHEAWEEHAHRMWSKSPDLFTEEEFHRVLEYLQEQY
ncbi:MAG: cytochrome c [Firmicutes bacterium]|nr:cytochrome c [Bacillota bacterium]